MIGILYCKDLLNHTDLLDIVETDICGINSVKLEVTLLSCVVLFIVGLYLLRKYKLRSHKTLLTFHNLRAAVALLLLAINTLELARSLLPTIITTGRGKQTLVGGAGNGYHEIGNVHNYSSSSSSSGITQDQSNESDLTWLIIGSGVLWNALAAIFLTIMLMWYHRIVELKKTAVFLYISSTLEVLIFIVRIYELAEVVYYENFFELESSLLVMTVLCLLGLSIIDGFTVYKERYRPDYIETYEKIGYKHTLATFYSKSCFWWLMPLLWFGYNEPLELEDLGQMRLEDSARAHYDRFLLIYKTAKGKNGNAPPSLWYCYVKNSWRMFTLGGILKLFGDLFALIGPLAIQQIVQYIEMLYGTISDGVAVPHTDSGGLHNISSNTSNGPKANLYGGMDDKNLNIRATGSIWLPNPDGGGNNSNNLSSFGNDYNQIDPSSSLSTALLSSLPSMASFGLNVKIYYPSWLDLVTNGWAIAWIVLLAALMQAALSQASTHMLNMTGIRIKTSLQGLIYRKTLLLNSSCNNNNNTNNCHDDDDNNDDDNTYNNDDNVTSTDVVTVSLVGGTIQNGVNHCKELKSVAINTSDDNANDNNKPALPHHQHQEHHQQQQQQPMEGPAQNPYPKQQQQQSQSSSSSAPASSLSSSSPLSRQQSKPNGMCALQAERESCLNDVGAITNLMTEDTLNIMSFFWIAHYVWAIPLKIAVVMYLLYLKLGISAVVGAFVCILTMTPLQFLIGKAMSNNSETIAKYTDERLKKMHDTLIGIKIIKLNAWDDVFLKKITAARQKELKYLNKDALYWTLMTILTHISLVLITFVTLAVYVCLPQENATEFTASHLFSALALFQQMTVPLLIFPITVPIIISAVVSTRRLESFLNAREILKQFEGIRNMARILSKSDASLDMYEAQEKSNLAMRTAQTENKLNERLALRIHIPTEPAPLAQSEPITPLLENGPECCIMNIPNDVLVPAENESNDIDKQPSYQYFERKHNNMVQHRRELLRNTPYVAIRPRRLPSGGYPLEKPIEFSLLRARNTDSWRRDSLLLKMSEDIAVSINDGLFSWQPGTQKAQLKVNDIAIPKGKLTLIVGKNGSGKSSLLNALLMEMPLVSGNMFWHKTSTISYVPQQPWLLNTSIRENILFGESFRPKRYEFVLEACALKPDIELMPDADFTVIGERGINLSGGQRQRVAIARAIYSSANVVIMDDPLSSLDNEVAHHVFEQCIQKMLLKSNRTIVLVTQQLQLVAKADYLIVMKDGCLHASGSYKDIEVTHPNLIAKWNSLIAKANEKEQENQETTLGRSTARERWKLFKNVSKLGLQRSISLTTETTDASHPIEMTTNNAGSNVSMTKSLGGEVGRIQAMAPIAVMDDIVDDEDDALLPVCLGGAHSHNGGSTFSLTRKRSGFYGSRHLIYEVPLPIDECQTEDVIMRRRRGVRGNTSSLSRSSTLRSRGSASTWSNRLSGISNASTATTNSDILQRSLLTASCSSTGSSIRQQEQSLTATELQQLTSQQQQSLPPTRVQSWQPQSVVPDEQMQTGESRLHKTTHKTVTRNASSPPGLQHVSSSTAVADVASSPTSSSTGGGTGGSSNGGGGGDGGFQQFLRRMSMRRSNKPNVVNIAHRKHHQRPLSATNSILSISEETTNTASLKSTDLSSVASSGAETAHDNLEGIEIGDINRVCMNDAATASWLANIEREAAMEDFNIDCKALTNDEHDMENSNISVNVNKNQQETITATTTTIATVAGGITYNKNNSMSSNNNNNNQNGITDVERKYGKISNHIYLLYIRASGLPIIIVFFITALIWQGLRVYTDVWLQHWSDNNGNHISVTAPTDAIKFVHASQQQQQQYDTTDLHTTSSSSSSHDLVTYHFCVYAIISCICILMAMISTPAGQWAGCNARRNLHDKLLHTIMRKSLHFFQVTPLGRIMNRFSNDMAIIDKKIAATSQRLLQFTLLCLCAILINVSVTPWFLLLTLPICAAYYAIQKFYRCSSRELQRIENATNSPVISHLSETIQGVTTIRAFSQEARFTEILFKRLEANTIAFTILNTSNRWLGISLDYLGGFIVFVAIVTALLTATISCNKQEQQQQQLETYVADTTKVNNIDKNNYEQLTPTPSLVGLAINYTLLVPIYLNWVVKLLADMEMYAGSVERISYYAESEVDAKETDEEVSDKSRIASAMTTIRTDVEAEITNEVDISLYHVDVDDDVAASAAVAVNGDRNVNKGATVDGDGAIDYANSHHTTSLKVVQDAVQLVKTLPTSDADDDRLNKCSSNTNIAEQRQHQQQHGSNIQDALLGNQVKLVSKSPVVTELEYAMKQKEQPQQLLEKHKATDDDDDVEARLYAGRRKKFKTVPISWPQRGDISFENVCLRYEGQRQHVIKDLTLKIPAGQRIGICGRTGSGKSSLALSLFGVLHTTSGRIRIDDVDITQIHPDEIRTRLSIIPQDVHLFNATIRENLDPYGYYSDLALWNCLELAQLKEFVNGQLPLGLDTEITDGGGINLSAGHRQLLCLARAILRGSVCLVLDEATSTLDSSTERALLTAAHKAFKGRTIITIAHRLSTIVDYDRIIVLENGKIIEDGAPQDLQYQQDSVFYALLHAGTTKNSTQNMEQAKRM